MPHSRTMAKRAVAYVCSVPNKPSHNAFIQVLAGHYARHAMKRREYKLHVETTPPEPIPALVEARWLKLADQALHPGRSKQAAPPPGTRAHQEHQRLEQEIDQALAKHNDEPDPANFIKIFDHGQDSSRTHPEPGAKAQTSQCASDGRSRRKATQSARIRAAGR